MMSVHLVTFASPDMSLSAELCKTSAERQGVDRVHLCVPSEPSTERGYGFWRWKPAVIHNVLTNASGFTPLNDGDILIYSDAGVEFIEPVSIVIDRMDQDIFLFGNDTEHAHWCKRDIVDAVWPNYQKGEFHVYPQNDDVSIPIEDISPHGGVYGRDPWFPFSKQVQASVIFFRVNDNTRAFVKEWLDWCLFEGGRLIDDSPSRMPNHPEFKENRHDQAILTTLAYREGYKLHGWYVKYDGYTPSRGSYTENYPPLYFHHRRRNHEWAA